MKEVYASLDFGSSTLKLIVAEIINSNIHILYSKKIPSKGIVKGEIVDIEATKASLKALLLDAADDLKAPIKKVLVNIPANQCRIYSSTGTAKILSDDKVITSSDVSKALKQAEKFEMDKQEFVVTSIPIRYKYDKFETEKTPIGKKASSLLVEALIMTTTKSVLYPYIKAVEGSGVGIIEICTNSYAAAKEVFDEASLFDGAVLIDIGHSTTTISFYENGFLQYIRVINSGSNDLSTSIASKWRITPEKAESYKVKYGSCIVDPIDQDIVAIVGEKQDQVVYRKSDLAKDLIDGVETLMKKISEKLQKVGSLDDKKIYIVGGGGELQGIEKVASKVFGVEVDTYRPAAIGARDMSFVNNLGIIYFLLDRKNIYGDTENSVDLPSVSNTVTLKLKGLTKTQTDNKIKSFVGKLMEDSDEE